MFILWAQSLFHFYLSVDNELTLLKQFGETYENKTQQVTVTHVLYQQNTLAH